MKKSTTLSLIPLVCLATLFSCSSDNSNTKTNSEFVSNCSVNTSSNTELSANSLLVEIYTGDNQLLADATIQLDHDGPCRRTDENGFIRFDDLSPGSHDVHFFAKPGYGWLSEYQVDTTTGEWLIFYADKIDSQANTAQPAASYININGTIINSGTNSTVFESEVSNIQKSSPLNVATGVNEPKTAYNLSYGYNQPETSSVDTELWFFEIERNSLDQFVLLDAVQVPVFPALTGPLTATGITKNIEFRTPQLKIPGTQLLSFASVSYPVGFTFSSIDIRSDFLSTDIPNKNHFVPLFIQVSSTNVPKTFPPNSQIKAYTTGLNFSNTSLNIIAEVTNADAISESTTWNYSTNRYLIGSNNITIQPKLLNVAALASNQQGDTISWSASTIPIKTFTMTIRSQVRDTEVNWEITVNGNLSKITIPVIPKGIQSILASGTKYNVRIKGRHLTSNLPLGETEIEFFSSNTLWTR